MIDLAICYAIGGVLVATFCGIGYGKWEVTFKDRPVKFPKLVALLFIGLLWPAVIVMAKIER